MCHLYLLGLRGKASLFLNQNQATALAPVLGLWVGKDGQDHLAKGRQARSTSESILGAVQKDLLASFGFSEDSGHLSLNVFAPPVSDPTVGICSCLPFLYLHEAPFSSLSH